MFFISHHISNNIFIALALLAICIMMIENSAEGKGLCIYTYPGGTLSILELWLRSQSPDGAGYIKGQVRACPWGGAYVPLHLQRDCPFCAMPLFQRRQQSVMSWSNIPVWQSIATFPFWSPGNTVPRFFSSWTLGRDCSIHSGACYVAESENSPFAILYIPNA